MEEEAFKKLYKKYGIESSKKSKRKKDMRLVMIVLIVGLVVASIAIIVFAWVLSPGAKTLELKSGFRYEYVITSSFTTTPSMTEIYVTKKTVNSREGITTVKYDEEMEVMFGRFKIDEDTNLSLSNPLSKEEVLDGNVDLYKLSELEDPSMVMALVPFSMLIYKEYGLDVEELIEKKSITFEGGTMILSGPVEHNGFLSYEVSAISEYGTEESKIYVSTVKPYILIETSSYGATYKLNKVEQKTFNLVDYEGYEAYISPFLQPPVPCSPCFIDFAYLDYSDGTLRITTGAREINYLQIFTDPQATLTLSWADNTASSIYPGTTLTISGFQTGETYTIILTYNDVNTGLVRTDTATLQA